MQWWWCDDDSPLSASGGGGGGGHQFLLSSRPGSIGNNGTANGSIAWGSFNGSFTESAAGDTAEGEGGGLCLSCRTSSAASCRIVDPERRRVAGAGPAQGRDRRPPGAGPGARREAALLVATRQQSWKSKIIEEEKNAKYGLFKYNQPLMKAGVAVFITAPSPRQKQFALCGQ